MSIFKYVTIYVSQNELNKIKLWKGISSDDANWLNTLCNANYVQVESDLFDDHIYSILDLNKVFYKITRD